MEKNEIVALFMGLRCEYFMTNPKRFTGMVIKDGTLTECKYDTDRNQFHEAWVKFRDLKFEPYEQHKNHRLLKKRIEVAICNYSLLEAFDELVKGVIWYNSIKK